MENIEKTKTNYNGVKLFDNKTDNTHNKNQILTLQNRKNLTITGVEKMISVKPDLIQLSTNTGDLQVIGVNMEMTKLELTEKIVEVAGLINQIRFVDDKKTPIFTIGVFYMQECLHICDRKQHRYNQSARYKLFFPLIFYRVRTNHRRYRRTETYHKSRQRIFGKTYVENKLNRASEPQNHKRD